MSMAGCHKPRGKYIVTGGGVLSEDGIWNALERRRELRGRLKKDGNL